MECKVSVVWAGEVEGVVWVGEVEEVVWVGGQRGWCG